MISKAIFFWNFFCFFWKNWILTDSDLKNAFFLLKKVLSEKMGFFRSKSVRIQFFFQKNKKNFKKKLPYLWDKYQLKFSLIIFVGRPRWVRTNYNWQRSLRSVATSAEGSRALRPMLITPSGCTWPPRLCGIWSKLKWNPTGTGNSPLTVSMPP